MALRRCARCGGDYDEIFFRKARSTSNSEWNEARHYICLGCEQTGRDNVKRDNRPLPKARRTLRHHATRFVRAGLANDQADFQIKFGWDPKQMAHDIEHHAKNGCPYCHKRFASMAHGLADVTLDIFDPRALPFYRTNVRWVCSTCNKAKRDDPPEVWGRKLECWAQWERRQAEAAARPQAVIQTLW